MPEILWDLLPSKEERSVEVEDKVDRPSGVPREHGRIKLRGVSLVSSSSNSNSNSNSNSKSKPNSTSGLGVSYGSSTVVGRKREMEDAISARPFFVSGDRNLHFFGVFDGHGCSHVAKSCRDRMHLLVAEEMALDEEVDWKSVVERSYARMDSEVVLGEEESERSSMPCQCKSGKTQHAGSTALVAIISSDHIVVGNCGDSRAVLLRGSSAVPLSSDHKPDREDELERIEGEGGKVIYWDGARVLGVLAMSRSIGDNYLKPYVTSHPEVTVTARTDDDECLVLASDGLWDVISNETACQMAKRCLVGGRSPAGAMTSEGSRSGSGSFSDSHSCSGSNKACIGAAWFLSTLATGKGSTDDITVIVVDLKTGRENHLM